MQKIVRGSFRWIGLCVGILSLAYFFNSALKQISSLSPVHWTPEGYISLAIATLLNSLVIILGGYAWLLLLRACGESARAVEGMVIFVLSQFAKYIPGNVVHHAGRIAIACSRGFAFYRVTLSMAIETGWIIVTASNLIIICLIFSDDIVLQYSQELSAPIKMALATSVAVVLPVIAGWILFRWRLGPVMKLFDTSSLKVPSSIVLICCLLIYTLCFFSMGIASDILIRGLFGVTESRVNLLTGAFAIAWTAGLFTPGAPAGLGVREAILLRLLSPVYGTGIAVELAITLRVVSIVADGLTFMLAIIVKWRLKPFFHEVFGNGQ